MNLLQITGKNYYKLRQFFTKYDSVLLQITVVYCKLRQCVITNFGNLIKILQITAPFGVIKNYDNTLLQITTLLKTES